MNTTKRLIFGILSSVLLAVGFAKAADQLDPITQNLPRTVGLPLQDSDHPISDKNPGDMNCATPDEN